MTYGTEVTTAAPPVLSDEHKQIDLFDEHEVAALPMPEGYKRPIAA